MNVQNPQITARNFDITVGVSPRFEMFNALRLILEPQPGIHDKWTARARESLPRAFFDRIDRLCALPAAWPNIADAVEARGLNNSFFEVLKAYAEVDPERFRYVILEGALHSAELAEALASGQVSFEDGVRGVPHKRREWLAFLGLFPFDAAAPVALFLQQVIDDPESVKDEIVRILSEFWDYAFDDAWTAMLPDMEKSASALERAVPSCSLAEIAGRALLRVEINEEEGYIRAALGGYTLPFAQIERVHFIPSAFNTNRLWTGYKNDETGKITAIFPYFDPEIAVFAGERQDRATMTRVIEPQLVFKALGDTTRYAMIHMLAQEPQTAVEIARRLNLTKATVSHHVQKLRIAGLINEEWSGGSVKLWLRREILEQLSNHMLRSLNYGLNEDGKPKGPPSLG